jgi:hypothetical protein
MLSCNRDVLLLIFGHCSLHGVGALSRTCTRLRAVVTGAGDEFWGRWARALLPGAWLSGPASMRDVLCEMRRPLGQDDFLFGSRAAAAREAS